MTERLDARPKRRTAVSTATSTSPEAAIRAERRRHARPAPTADDRFSRHIVNSMRNGVIAFRRNGVLALMNDEAYRIFGLTPVEGDIGRPFNEVLRDRPDVIRV